MSPAKSPDEVTAVSARLPKEVRDALVRSAQDSCRSINAELVFRLRQSLREERRAEPLA